MNRFYFSIVACLLFSCNQAIIEKVSIDKIETYKPKYGVSHEDNITPTKIASFDNNTFYYYLNWEKNKLYSYNIETDTLINEADVSSVSEFISFRRNTQVQWLKNNLIVFFSNEDQKLILVDTIGEIVQIINTSEEDIEEPYVSVSYFDRTFGYYQNNVFFNKAYVDFVLSEKEDYIKYYSRPMVVSINLLDKTKNHFLKAPSSYQDGNSFGSFDIYNCVGGDNELIFSFPSNDSLFVYKDFKLVKKVYAGNLKKHEFQPYDVSKNNNLALKRKYNITKPFYQKIVYDSYRNLFFRVFKKESPYLNEDGTVKRDYNWSLIVLNYNFEVIGELPFNSREYSPLVIAPCKKGIIISSSIDKGLVSSYTLFNIEIKEI